MEDIASLAAGMSNPIQLSTDPLVAYHQTIEDGAFPTDRVDHRVLKKRYNGVDRPDQLYRAPEPHHENVGAPVHPPHQRLLEETGESPCAVALPL